MPLNYGVVLQPTASIVAGDNSSAGGLAVKGQGPRGNESSYQDATETPSIPVEKSDVNKPTEATIIRGAGCPLLYWTLYKGKCY